MANTWTHVSLTVCTVKSLFLQTLCWNIFWSRAYSTTFFANYHPELDVLINVAPSIALCFHEDKIGILPLVALCSLYTSKLLNCVNAFNRYKQKWTLVPFNLAHRVVVYIVHVCGMFAHVRRDMTYYAHCSMRRWRIPLCCYCCSSIPPPSLHHSPCHLLPVDENTPSNYRRRRANMPIKFATMR